MLRFHRGQACVEFALTASIFFLLALGIVEGARAYLTYTVVASCAREAARSGAAHLGQPGWDANARAAGYQLAVGVDPAQMTINVSQQTIDSALQPYVEADVEYEFQTIVPLVGSVLGNPIHLNASAVVLAG
jgi:Flp pilus assembly protein TadG